MTIIATFKSRLADARRAAPRRARRGFSMMEMVLVLIITAMIMQTGIELATSYTKRQITQRTAANMSRVADDVESYMDRNYFTLLTQVDAAANDVLEVDWSDLIDANLVSMDAAPVSPDGGTLRLFFTLRSDTIYAVILSFDGSGSNYSPRPDPVTKFAGKVQGNAPNDLVGWDFTLDISQIATLAGESLVGDIGVMRYIANDVNVDPYLHRIAIPGHPELNEMEGDLDMGGFDITNALVVTTDDLDVQDEMAVAGRVQADTIATTGDAEIGEVNADSASVDEVATNNVTVTNRTTTTHAVASGITTSTLQSTSASFSNLTAENLTGGSIFLTSGNYIQIDVNRVDADEVIANDVFIGD